MKNDIRTTETATLCSLAESLKVDAKAAEHTNRAEALRLFNLSQQIHVELFRRERLKSQAYLYN